MTVEILMFSMIVLMLLFEIATHKKTHQQLNTGELTKLSCYRHTMLFLWIPALICIVLIVMDYLPRSLLPLPMLASKSELYGLGIVLAAGGYFAYSLYATQKQTDTHPELFRHFKPVAFIMPNTPKERRWFIWGVSISAGVCEEIIFRAVLIYILNLHMDVILAIVLSSLIFGLMHLYQGWLGVIKTFSVGLLLAAIYVWTNSLWVVIALHFLVDAYSGQLYYLVSNSKNINQADPY